MEPISVTDHSKVINRFSDATLWVLFISLALLTLVFRDLYLLSSVATGKVDELSPDNLTLSCTQLPSCLRIVGNLSHGLIAWVLIEASRLLDLLPARYAPDTLDLAFKEGLLYFFAGALARILPLLAIYFYIRNAYKGLLPSALLMIGIFVAFLGWARSNPLFQEQFMVIYDWWATGFLFALLYYFHRRATWRFYEIAGLMIVGQLIFEHLSIVTAIAAVFTYFRHDPSHSNGQCWKRAFMRLLQLGLVSLSGAVITIYLLKWTTADSATKPENNADVLAYIKNAWMTYGRDNWNDAYDIFENFSELMAYPILAGLIVGIVVLVQFKHAALQPDQGLAAQQSRDTRAATGVCLGFMVTLIPGFFLSGLYYEMGRQLVPLACVVIVMIAKSTEYLFFRPWRKAAHEA